MLTRDDIASLKVEARRRLEAAGFAVSFDEAEGIEVADLA
jgi:hypothetical protein